MKAFLYHIAAVLFHLGGFGLLAMGVLDSSFLIMPLGNDLLVVAMSANNHRHMPYYAVMAAAGSVLGVFLIDLVFRTGGEKALQKHVSEKRLAYVRKKVDKEAGWALAFAAIMPPPFPFTPFVAASSALEYPRKKLLSVIAATRLLRFSVEGLLAIWFGKGILNLAKSPAVQYGIIALILASIGASAFSVVRWVRRSKKPKVRHAGGS